MGIIQRQGSINTVLSYIGAGLGVLNLIFLYPLFFRPDEIGLVRILMSVSLIYAHVASFGLGSIIIRYFPHFKTKTDNRHHGFAPAMLLLAAAGFLVATGLFYALEPVITAQYLQNSPLFVDYYHYLVPLSLFVFLFNVFEFLDRAVFRTVFTLFCREVLLRVLTALGIAMVAINWINFEQFMVWFLGIHVFSALGVIVNNLISRSFNFAFSWDFFRWKRLRVLYRYGLITWLTGATTFVVQSVDALMLGAFLDLEAVGIYTVAFFMGSVIAMPARGISRIATPIVAEAWKLNLVNRIASIYRSTSFLQFTAGLLLLAVILINLKAIYTFLPPVFSKGMGVVALIGAGHLMDMTGGLNTNILATSRQFTKDLYFNVLFVAACILLNYQLIPLYGLEGAALASMLSYLIVNLVRSGYLAWHFRMQPLHRGYLLVLFCVMVAAYIAFRLPLESWNPILQIVLRSGVFLTLAAGLALLTKTDQQVRDALRRMT